MTRWFRAGMLFTWVAGCNTPGCGAAPAEVEREGIEAEL